MHYEYTALMSLVLDGEATAVETQRLHEHLRACHACAETWQQWRAIDRRFATALRLTAPVGLADRVLAGLEAAELRRRRIRWLGSGLLAGWVSLAAGVAILLSLAAVWFQGNMAQIASSGLLVVRWISALLLLAHAAVTAVGSLGAPALAGAAGVLACVTCVLGATWLWLLSRRGQLHGAAPSVVR